MKGKLSCTVLKTNGVACNLVEFNKSPEHQQLQLSFDVLISPKIEAAFDPYWDELESQTDDIVEQAFLSINAENEIFDIEAEFAPKDVNVDTNRNTPCA